MISEDSDVYGYYWSWFDVVDHLLGIWIWFIFWCCQVKAPTYLEIYRKSNMKWKWNCWVVETIEIVKILKLFMPKLANSGRGSKFDNRNELSQTQNCITINKYLKFQLLNAFSAKILALTLCPCCQLYVSSNRPCVVDSIFWVL